jgi:hypothetical protein
MVTKREHLIALRQHDWSYMMSDDGSVYRRGAAAESGLITAEKTNPELAGMYDTYRRWWWGLAEGSNTAESGPGRHSKAPEPTFGVAME